MYRYVAPEESLGQRFKRVCKSPMVIAHGGHFGGVKPKVSSGSAGVLARNHSLNVTVFSFLSGARSTGAVLL